MRLKLIVEVDEDRIQEIAEEIGSTGIEETVINEMSWVSESGIHLKSLEHVKEE